MNRVIKFFLAIIFIGGLIIALSSVFAITPNNNIPIDPEVIDITEYSITLRKIEGYEYSMDEGRHWQSSNVFSFLEPMATYSFIQRIKETGDYEYSSNSQIIEIKTNILTNKSVNKIPNGFIPIYSIEDLRKVENNLSGNYILMNDIICDENMEPFKPIGNQTEQFSGIFNGNCHSIIGLKQVNNSTLGLFEENYGIIINLNLINNSFQISEDGEIIYTIGNITGYNYGEIIGCSCKNNIEIDKGLVLGGRKSLRDSSSNTSIKIGGIAGVNYREYILL